MDDTLLTKQYEFIVNTSKDLMTLIDHTYTYKAVNEAYCRAHNKIRTDIVGETVPNVWGEARYLTQIKPSLDQCFAGEEVHYQGWFEITDRGRRYFDVIYYPYIDNDNIVTHVVVVSRDVTQLKKTEEELQHRNRELVLLNQIIAASTTGLDPEAILETVCRELAQTLDVSGVTAILFNESKSTAHIVAEYVTVGNIPTLHEPITVATDSVFQYLLNHQGPLVINEASNDSRLTHSHYAAANTPIGSLLVLPLIVDDSVVGALSLLTYKVQPFSPAEINLGWSVVDQVAGVLARVRLNQEYRRLSVAIDQTVDIVIITNTQGVVVYANPVFEQISGHSRQNIIGQTPKLFQSGKHDAAFYKELWQTISARQVWHGQFVNKKKDGTFYTVDATITPVRDEDNRIINYLAVERDITHELQLEEQLRQAQKMEAIGRLAGGVAHDFNNILTVINGHSELLLQRHLGHDDPQRWEVEQILDAGERAAVLTHQLLAFSRRQALQVEVLNLNNVVTDLQKMLRRLIGKNIEIDLNLDPNLGLVETDSGQMDQVLMNLVVNARDAMPKGGKLAITTANVNLDPDYFQKHVEMIPGPYILLSVADTGIGLDAETQSHIFEPFFTTKEEGKGTGLGLSTVYGIVRQNKGYVWVYSEINKGTTFKIYMPQVTENIDEMLTPHPAPVTSLKGTETILVVEDEPDVRTVACQFLQRQGYTVLETGYPKEALALCQKRQQKIDLLITDVVMPGMSGRELAEQLNRTCQEIKVLYISGYAHDTLSHYDLAGSGISFLEKPFSSEGLARKVRETLDT